MAKSRRSVEENKGISIATIVILVIILISLTFISIFLLFSETEVNKSIVSLNNSIESLKLESTNLKEKEEEINLLLENVSDSQTFINIYKENYKSLLPSFEDEIKSFETDEKIAYLVFVVDKTDNLDKTLEILNNNRVLSIFFTNDKECADKIIKSGNLLGLYIDDEKTIDNIDEEYKDIIEAYDLDLYMVSQNLNEKESVSNTLHKVTENSTAEGKKLLNQSGYIGDIVDTTADRDFLIIRINLSNNVGVGSIEGIISKLKDKNYMFLPLVSSSSLINK